MSPPITTHFVTVDGLRLHYREAEVGHPCSSSTGSPAPALLAGFFAASTD